MSAGRVKKVRDHQFPRSLDLPQERAVCASAGQENPRNYDKNFLSDRGQNVAQSQIQGKQGFS